MHKGLQVLAASYIVIRETRFVLLSRAIRAKLVHNANDHHMGLRLRCTFYAKGNINNPHREVRVLGFE